MNEQTQHIQLPWMPITIDKFIGGTTSFSAAETGAYLLLLLHQWRNGHVPESPEELSAISKLKHKQLLKVLRKFTQDVDGTLFNERCRAEYLKQLKSYTGKVERMADINERKRVEKEAKLERERLIRNLRNEIEHDKGNEHAHDIVHENGNAQAAQQPTNTGTTSLTISDTEKRKEKGDSSYRTVINSLSLPAQERNAKHQPNQTVYNLAHFEALGHKWEMEPALRTALDKWLEYRQFGHGPLTSHHSIEAILMRFSTLPHSVEVKCEMIDYSIEKNSKNIIYETHALNEAKKQNNQSPNKNFKNNTQTTATIAAKPAYLP